MTGQVDVKRVAAMIAECDDDSELAEVLAEVYKMLPVAQQAAFRAATGPRPNASAAPAYRDVPVKVIEAKPGSIEVVPVKPPGA